MRRKLPELDKKLNDLVLERVIISHGHGGVKQVVVEGDEIARPALLFSVVPVELGLIDCSVHVIKSSSKLNHGIDIVAEQVLSDSSRQMVVKVDIGLCLRTSVQVRV